MCLAGQVCLHASRVHGRAGPPAVDETQLKCSRSAARASRRKKCSRNLGPAAALQHAWGSVTGHLRAAHLSGSAGVFHAGSGLNDRQSQIC